MEKEIEALAAMDCEGMTPCKIEDLVYDESCYPCHARFIISASGKPTNELTEVAGLRAQIADFKERSDIMDALHKETMEKVEGYKKALGEMRDVPSRKK